VRSISLTNFRFIHRVVAVLNQFSSNVSNPSSVGLMLLDFIITSTQRSRVSRRNIFCSTKQCKHPMRNDYPNIMHQTHHKNIIRPPKKAIIAISAPTHGINIPDPPVKGGSPELVFCGVVPVPIIVGVELLVVVAAAAGAELVELGAAAEALVDTGLEEVVGPAPAEPALDTQVQIAFAAARTDTAVAWQLESTQPCAAELIAAY
jgi:hypothetical protein